MTNEKDYQLGTSPVDTTPNIDGDFVPFDMESSVVFSTLAEDIYPSPDSGIREAITNSITANMKVDEENYEPVISIKLTDSEGVLKLIIEDNGIGMDMSVIKNVVSQIGRSTVRDDYDKAGQFGMGFLALFSLSGTNGGFIMHTNARYDNTEPISGRWKDGGFSKFDSPTEKAKNIKGTCFEIYLKEDISSDDIREWVENKSKYSRIPITYEEQIGESVYSEDYGNFKLESLIKNNSNAIILDTDYYKVVCADELIDTPTILLDVEIDKNYTVNKYLPYNKFAIRLKSEHPVVVDGKYEGKMVVRQTEYEQIPENRRNKYVPNINISENKPITPAPTGNREQLKENNIFWDYICTEIRRKHKLNIKNIICKISNNKPLNSKKWEYLQSEYNKYKNDYTRLDSLIHSQYTDIYNSKITERIYANMQKLSIHNYNINSGSINKLEEEKVYEINEKYDKVFMIISSVNDKKATIIDSVCNNYAIVKIPSSEWYELYETNCNWYKLKDISESHQICENIENVNKFIQKNKSQKNKTKPTKNSTVVVYYGGNNKRKKLSVDKLLQSIKSNNGDYYLELKNLKISEIITFENNSKYNINDYKWITSNNRAVIRLKDEQQKIALENNPLTISIDDKIENNLDMELPTSHGYKTVEDLEFNNCLIHILDNNMYNYILQENNINKMNELFNNNKFSNVSVVTKEIYVPMRLETLNKIVPHVKLSTIVNNINKIGLHNYDGPTNNQCKLYLDNYEYRNNDIIEVIDNKIFATESMNIQKSMLNLLSEVNNSDIDLTEVIINE